ncbi:hypothetical protein [Arthrobacter sp. D2-10]
MLDATTDPSTPFSPDWVNIGVGVASIFVAASISLLVAYLQHRRHVLHEARVEVAIMLTQHRRILRAFRPIAFTFSQQQNLSWEHGDYVEANKIASVIEPMIDAMVGHAVTINMIAPKSWHVAARQLVEAHEKLLGGIRQLCSAYDLGLNTNDLTAKIPDLRKEVISWQRVLLKKAGG